MFVNGMIRMVLQLPFSFSVFNIHISPCLPTLFLKVLYSILQRGSAAFSLHITLSRAF